MKSKTDLITILGYLFIPIYIGFSLLLIFIDYPLNIICAAIGGFAIISFIYYSKKTRLNRVFNKKTELVAISTKQSIRFFLLIVLLFSNYLINALIHDQLKENLSLLIFLSIILIGEFTFQFILKIRPVNTIMISENDLVMNYQYLFKRNLKELKSIELNGLTEIITLSFTEEYKLKIKRTEFNQNELEGLLKLSIKKSSHKVQVSPNLFRLIDTKVGNKENDSSIL